MTLTVTRSMGWVFCGLPLCGNSSDAWLPFKYPLRCPVCWLALRCLGVFASESGALYCVRTKGGSCAVLGAGEGICAVSPGHCCNWVGCSVFPPLWCCFTSVSRISLGRTDLADSLGEQERQPDVSRKGVWCPISSGPIEGARWWCLKEPCLG